MRNSPVGPQTEQLYAHRQGAQARWPKSGPAVTLGGLWSNSYKENTVLVTEQTFKYQMQLHYNEIYETLIKQSSTITWEYLCYICYVPVDVQSQAVGLPAHRGRVGFQQEAAQELNQSFFVCKFVELTDQSTTQLILLTAHSLTFTGQNKRQKTTLKRACQQKKKSDCILSLKTHLATFKSLLTLTWGEWATGTGTQIVVQIETKKSFLLE